VDPENQPNFEQVAILRRTAFKKQQVGTLNSTGWPPGQQGLPLRDPGKDNFNAFAPDIGHLSR